MQCRVCACGNNRVVRDHQNRFVVLADQLIDEGHDFIGALAVQVAGGLVAEEERGVGDYGASDSDALLLSAGELARVVMHAIGQIETTPRAVSTCLRRSALDSLVKRSGSSTF